MGTEESSIPLNWALYLSEEWIHDKERRKKAGIPEEAVFKTKLELALDLIDEARSWGLHDRLVLADSLYGDSYEFRQGLKSRKVDYIVQVEGKLLAWTEDPHPAESLLKKGGKIPRKRFYAKDLPPAGSLQEIARGLTQESWQKITWREGTKGPPSSRFARLVVWLSSLDPVTSWRNLVRKAKGRFRVEQDYREMKRELGLDHFEGRSWQEWHHHVILVAMAYAFFMLERIGNKKKLLD